MELARHFIRGSGLEIGALHGPLDVPPEASVTYVDRMNVEELRGHYAELAELDFAPVDIVDDGERLTTVPDESQDFIIANHFLEHCEDPIGTIGSHLLKLKPGGVLFYAVPDKRYTFDFRRPNTPLEHMISDHEQGPHHSRREHYEEWVRLVRDEPGPMAEDRARELEAAGYSIHTHVWTQVEFLEFLLHCQRRFDKAFEIEAFARRSIEIVVVLRKAGPIAHLRQAPASPDARTIEILEERLDDATARLWRIEQSVTWQLFQRFRRRSFALLGGETSRPVSLLQSVLRGAGSILLRRRTR
jgi:SAM-dependent methyltransferase